MGFKVTSRGGKKRKFSSANFCSVFGEKEFAPKETINKVEAIRSRVIGSTKMVHTCLFSSYLLLIGALLLYVYFFPVLPTSVSERIRAMSGPKHGGAGGN